LKADKDEYQLKAYVRHDKKDVLDKLQDMPMTLMTKLSSPISLDIYNSHPQASLSGKKCSSMSLNKGWICPLYLTAPNVNDKYTKHAGMGQYLQGSLTLAKDEQGKKVNVHTVKYILNESAKKATNDKANKGQKAKEQSLNESLNEAKINWIGKMDPNTDEALKLYESLRKDDSAHQGQLRLARMSAFAIDRKLDSCESLSKKAAKEIIDLANEITDLIKEEDILLFYGTKFDARQDAAEIKKDMEKNRGVLIEALAKKGLALVSQGNVDEATDVLFKLLKFTDITDAKVVTFAIVHAEQIQHYARAIKLIQSQLESKPNSPELEQKLIQLYDALGWEHCSKFAKESYPTRFPQDFELH
jgi:tripeptidyl-peptidase-2